MTADKYVQCAVFPELKNGSTHWIITPPQGPSLSFYERYNAERCFARGWQVETAYEWITRILIEIREGSRIYLSDLPFSLKSHHIP